MELRLALFKVLVKPFFFFFFGGGGGGDFSYGPCVCNRFNF